MQFRGERTAAASGAATGSGVGRRRNGRVRVGVEVARRPGHRSADTPMRQRDL